MLSEFYQFGLRSNPWYTFDGASLSRLGDYSVCVKRTAAKQNGPPTHVGRSQKPSHMTTPLFGITGNLANLGGAWELLYKGSFYGNISSQLWLANCIVVWTRSVTESRCSRESLMLVYRVSQKTDHFLKLCMLLCAITRWHGSPRVFKDENASQWKSEKFDPSSPPQKKNTGPIVTKICIGDYVWDPCLYAKFHHEYDYRFSPPPPPPKKKNMRKCASRDSASFFGFFRQPTAKTLAVHWFLRSIRQSTSFCVKMCLLGVWKKLHLDPIPPKTKIGPIFDGI